MTAALVLAVLSIPLTAHALWFDRPKLAGRSYWGCRALYGMSWASIAASLVMWWIA